MSQAGSGQPAGGADAGQALPIGTRLAEFEITGLIGAGGFGIVYLATDHSLQRRVALKEYMPSALAIRGGDLQVTIKSDRARDTFDTGLRSFISEARMLAQFDHPALIKVYRFWQANGTAYMAMPYYRGPTLRNALRKLGSVPSEPWLRAMLAPLIDALDTLHQANCLHRDIAPDNILMLENGQPLLLDFGAARRVIGDATQDLTVILKPGFAPIEQYSSGPEMKQGPWTDIYALASVVYYCASGKAPVPSVSRLMSDTLAPLERVPGANLSAQFCAAIGKAMAVRIEARTQSIADLRHDLGLDMASTAQLDLAAFGRGAGPVAASPEREPSDPLGLDFVVRPLVGAGHGNEPVLGPFAATALRDPPTPAPHRPVSRSAGLRLGGVLGGAVLLAAAIWLLRSAEQPSLRDDHANAPLGESQANPSPPVRGSNAPPADSMPPPPGPPPPVSPPLTPQLPSVPAPRATSDVSPHSKPALAPPESPVGATSAMPEPTRLYASRDVIDALKAVADPQLSIDVTLKTTRVKIGRDSLDFKIRSPIAGYLYVLMSGTHGDDLYMLFPNDKDRGNRISADVELSVPKSNWKIDFAGPPGVNRFIVLISPKPRDFKMAGWRAAGPFKEFDPAIGAQRLRARELHAFSGAPLDCADAACLRFGAEVFDIEEYR